MRKLMTIAFALCAAAPAVAAVKTKEVHYEFGGTTFKGVLAWDDAAEGKRPGVVVFHEWWGLDDYARKRAEQLAGMGYVAFAADLYGNGKVVDHPKDAGAMANELRGKADAWRGRARAALKVLTDFEKTDPTRLAAIGYCFGGSTALQLAYSGADLDAVATFHAALPTPTPQQAKAIKARILVCHGAEDSFIGQESIDKFQQALKDAKVELTFESYPGAVHSFTVPEADKRKLNGIAYNAAADKKSWASMVSLFRKVFGKD